MEPRLICNIDPNVLINVVTERCVNIEMDVMYREGNFIKQDDLPDYVRGMRARVKHILELSN